MELDFSSCLLLALKMTQSLHRDTEHTLLYHWVKSQKLGYYGDSSRHRLSSFWKIHRLTVFQSTVTWCGSSQTLQTPKIKPALISVSSVLYNLCMKGPILCIIYILLRCSHSWPCSSGQRGLVRPSTGKL